MTRSLTIAASLAAALCLALTTPADAGSCGGGNKWNPPIVLPPPVTFPKPPICLPRPPICLPKPPICLPKPPICLPKPPIVCPPPVVCPKPPVVCPPPVCHKPVTPVCLRWYFGMSVQMINTHYGPGVQVYSVQPGSPAQLAGLEPGDVMLNANNLPLAGARTNDEAVQLIQSAVTENTPVGSGPISGAPSPTFMLASTGAVQQQPVASTHGSVQLTVIDVRSNTLTQLMVYPQSLTESPAPTTTFAAPATAAPAPAATH